MYKIVAVKFKPTGKAYYFDPLGFDIKKNDNVIVETVRGLEYGTVSYGIQELEEKDIPKPLKGVIRMATPEDTKRAEENRRCEREAFEICTQKIKKHELEMKLVEVEYTFDRSKILFYFTADGRVDFRELVKDLANVFRTRIELRQIGVRDESKTMGSIGVCGRGLCCSQWLGEFVPVSIKMAKEQGLSLNPAKISGACGRLMCCLKYEQDTYEQLIREMPKPQTPIMTPDGEGVVEEISLIRGMVKVRFEAEDEKSVKEYKATDLKPVRKKRKDNKKFDKSIED
ncbi:MAG: stage 0 sporulation family protein [Clostridiales bacterium]|nr:stage 0 sporulation family protein [Clostridiales bacterium]